jgi:nucleoside phosphorylase
VHESSTSENLVPTSGGSPASGSTVVVLTALDLEYRALQDHVGHTRPVRGASAVWQVGALSAPGWNIALVSGARGNTRASILVHEAVEIFKPKAVMFVGVAGGLGRLATVADIVLSAKVYDSHGTEASLPSGQTEWHPDAGLVEIAQQVGADESWLETRVPWAPQLRPNIFYAPTVTSIAVVTNHDEKLWQALRRRYKDALAVDMEDAGFAAGASSAGEIDSLIVRCISDEVVGSHKRHSDRHGWRQLAADLAAGFTFEVIDRYIGGSLHGFGPAKQDSFDPAFRIGPDEPVRKAHSNRQSYWSDPNVSFAWAYSSVVAPSGEWIVTTDGSERAQVWDVSSGEQRFVLTGHEGPVYSCAVSPDGTWLVTTSADCTAQVWDATTGEQRFVLVGHTDWVFRCAIGPDGDWVATASDDGTVRIWGVAGGELNHVLNAGRAWPYSCVAAPGDSWICVTSGDDRLARIWDVSTGKLIHELHGHKGPVYSCSVSPDSRLIVTASYDGTARIWDVDSGALRATLKGHLGPVRSCVFAGNGSWVLTAGDDGTVRVWDTLTGSETATVTQPDDSNIRRFDDVDAFALFAGRGIYLGADSGTSYPP